ncbi:T9SS sorting signal type C domain-containing protein [Algibacter sp. L3A6]|uniref:T9SS sorting signal type C domain-containing protein n=1 Tax=Algibacter sp. L3A6 TaxID=2686366 RepID=UPI00131E2E78|nr:T9SS sorting signal type C domain-containing protein [Algibacter sp. L3A6]
MTKPTQNTYKTLFTSMKNTLKKEKTSTLSIGFALFATVLTCQFAEAQLAVRNNAYVYVNDEIVFVEDDINLGEPASTIYLRTDAQVIQGTGTTGNSGEGALSVYQDGNVGVYEYNYWCSPTGLPAAAAGNGLFGITLLNDIVDDVISTSAGTTHQPGYNGTSDPLNIEPYWIWTFVNGTDYSEWNPIGNATAIPPGYGFTMKGTAGTSSNNPGDNQKYDFRGKPNTGQISVPITAGENSLVGNPYPSAMDAHAYIWDANNRNTITGTLYYWEQDPSVNSHNLNAYDGGYATYTISEDENTEIKVSAVFKTYNNDGSENGNSGTPSSGDVPTRFIPIGQGFMVLGHPSAPAMSNVNAENRHRVYEKEDGIGSAFFRSTNSKTSETVTNSLFTPVPSDYKRFRLNVDFNNLYTRQIVETFSPSATEGFDRGLESRLHDDDILSSDAYFSIENLSYLAEALVYDENLKIPFTVKIANDMPLRIRIADVQNFDSDLPIYIHDKTTDLYVNLQSQDFSVNLDAGNYTERFEVTFRADVTLATEEHLVDSMDAIQNNTTDILKVLNPSNLDIKSIFVYDVAGKQVITERPNAISNAYELSTKQLSTGVYIVKATLDNNTTFNKKIIIN